MGQFGLLSKRPFEFPFHPVAWSCDQEDMAVRAIVHFRDSSEIVYNTPTLRGLSIPERGQSKVALYTSEDLPRPFWSRANRERKCTIHLDMESEQIEQAKLHVVIWDGGRGEVEAPFSLNGYPMPVAGTGRHDVIYRELSVDPKMLKKGANEIRLISDTKHHGIEILLPGPALMMRSRLA